MDVNKERSDIQSARKEVEKDEWTKNCNRMRAFNKNTHPSMEDAQRKVNKHTSRLPVKFLMMLINSLDSPLEKVVSGASDMIACSVCLIVVDCV